MYEIQRLTPEEFPRNLLELPQPPQQLSYRGDLPSPDARLLCIVGSRRYTSYGKEVCTKIISELTSTDIVIVSGLALGIDAIAHEAALQVGLTTMAIPGSGLNSDVLYPATNRPLAKRILDHGGALLSEFNDDTRAAPYTFPQRNRLMAGIAHGIVVIEAQEKSGTLITARLATEYNKDVFAIPHSIFSQTSAGPHRLIKTGAIPVTSGSDILEHWGMSDDTLLLDTNKKLFNDCSLAEQCILSLLQEPLSRDELIRQSDLPTHEINTLLSAMEIKGLVVERLGKIHSTF